MIKKRAISSMLLAAIVGFVFLVTSCAPSGQPSESAASAVEEKALLGRDENDYADSPGLGIVNATEESEGGTELTADSTVNQSAVGEGTDDVLAKAEDLIVDSDPVEYTYENMIGDIVALAQRYPEWVRYDSLGITADGRELYHLVIGNPDASRSILIHAGIHAREYITTQLVMKQASAFLAHSAAGDAFNESLYTDVLDDCSIHVIPNVNPDGFVISQIGIGALRHEDLYESIVEIAALDGSEPTEGYFRAWKANANGVDLNRNFDALWAEYEGTGRPSRERYKGSYPGSEVESAALIDLTKRCQFSRTISYHTAGSVVYWYFGQTGTLLEQTENFAQAISNVTGYALDANYEALDPAGYKDWCLHSLGIPSLTIEVGIGDSPIAPASFPEIWAQNEHVWETSLEM